MKSYFGLTKKKYKYSKFLQDILLYVDKEGGGRCYIGKDGDKYIPVRDGYFYKLDKRYADYYVELMPSSNDYNWEQQEEDDENWAYLKKYMIENNFK